MVPVCPEQLGGLSTPRPASAFVGGDGAAVLAGRARLVNDAGADVTEHFVRGAQATLRIARQTGAQRALLKDRSPSCGRTCVTIDGRRTSGVGVTAALLEEAGITVVPV